MKLNYNMLSVVVVASIATLTSCNSNNKEIQDANHQQIEQQVNPNQAKIVELEAQRDAIIEKIEAIGKEYQAYHPEISEDAIIDSLNVHTFTLRQQSRQLEQQIDSLKSL